MERILGNVSSFSSRYPGIDKFICQESKLTGDALTAVAGYQLSNKTTQLLMF